MYGHIDLPITYTINYSITLGHVVPSAALPTRWIFIKNVLLTSFDIGARDLDTSGTTLYTHWITIGY